MRIRIIQGAENDTTQLVAQTTDLLRSELQTLPQHLLVDDNPDVIHIIGAWDKNSMNVARQAHTRHIAILYTPVASLAPWHKPSDTKKKFTANATIIVASGKMEYSFFSDDMPNLFLVKNPITTATTTKQEMLESYCRLYRKAYDMNEECLQKEIMEKVQLLKEEDSTINHICEKLFYAEKLYERRNIPLSYAKALADYLIAHNYDEDHLNEILKLIHLDVFTQQFEHVMKERCGLTEGFMPIIWKEDKTSLDMLSVITEYEAEPKEENNENITTL